MNILFENSYVELYSLAPQTPYTILAHWKGYFTTEDEKSLETLKIALDFYKSFNTKVLISDHKQMTGTCINFVDWLHTDYFPKSIEGGLIAELVIESEDFIANASLDILYDPSEFKKDVLYTQKVDSLENAKIVAQRIIDKN